MTDNFITDAQPMAQVAEQDLVALQAQIAHLQSILAEIKEIAEESYYTDGYDDVLLERILIVSDRRMRNANDSNN